VANRDPQLHQRVELTRHARLSGKVSNAIALVARTGIDEDRAMIRNMVLLGLGVVSGCAVDREPLTSNVDQPIQVEACHGATTAPNAEFTLENVSRDASDLLVDVNTGGGCGPHRFAACWDGLVQPSAPPMLALELTQDADDLCEARLSFQLRIDPSALRARGLIPGYLFIRGAVSQADGVNTGTLVE
jgi:hypothetical protein